MFNYLIYQIIKQINKTKDVEKCCISGNIYYLGEECK